MHEIITLQLGRQSNFVASHFWNAQESYFTYGDDAPAPVDHDIHWRAGVGADGSETFLPRTVVYDRKGGFGSLRKVNALYEAEAPPPSAAAAGLWSGAAVVHRAPPIAPSAYTQSLDAGGDAAALTPSAVRYWSDYSRVYYHPRSLIEVGDEPEGAAGDTDAEAALSWAAGDALFAALDREHDLLDRDLRPFIEEADQMQGLQVLASADDAWGGFAARYLERMRDEYGKTTVWLWALQEPASRLPRDKRIVRLGNKVRTFAEAYEQASLIIPVTVPSVLLRPIASVFDPTSVWHTAALVATAMETATLPARLRPGAGGDSLSYLTELLNATGGQRVANVQMTAAQPWRAIQKAQKADTERNGQDYEDGPPALHLDVDFAPQDDPRTGVYANGARTTKKTRMFGQAVVTRSSALAQDMEEEDSAAREGVYDDREPDREDMARRRFALKPVSQRYCVDLGFPMLDSFPALYQRTPTDAPSVPVTTALATDSGVADRLKALRTTVVAPWAISLDDREALGNDLATMADAYHDGWSSGSDEDDDD